MSSNIKRILSLWLAIALALAPLPAFSSTAAFLDTGHCMMGQHHPDSTTSASSLPRVDAGHAMPGCKHCKDDVCSDQGCSPCHGSLVSAPALSIEIPRNSQVLSLTPETDLVSRSDPPLLRPPL